MRAAINHLSARVRKPVHCGSWLADCDPFCLLLFFQGPLVVVVYMIDGSEKLCFELQSSRVIERRSTATSLSIITTFLTWLSSLVFSLKAGFWHACLSRLSSWARHFKSAFHMYFNRMYWIYTRDLQKSTNLNPCTSSWMCLSATIGLPLLTIM